VVLGLLVVALLVLLFGLYAAAGSLHPSLASGPPAGPCGRLPEMKGRPILFVHHGYVITHSSCR
jgi:hypothetical protein